MAAFPVEALIAAGGQILSSALGGSKTMSPSKQIQSTVKGARKAGIHPLAALGSGAQYTQVSGGVNAGDAIGAGMTELAKGMAAQKSDAEVDALKASSEAQRAQADLYRAQSRTLISKTRSAAIGGPRVDDQPPKAKKLRMFGSDIERDASRFSTAQDVQDEFGDVAENVVGIPSFGWSALRAADKALPTDQQIMDALSRWSRRPAYQFNQGNYGR